MAPDFDKIAPWYQLLERVAFLGALQRCRLAMLDELPRAERVLILGEGDGRFLEAFLHRQPQAQVTVIDASRRMLDLARARIREDPDVRFVHADVMQADCDLPAADLVITLFFLDCFDDREQTQLIAKVGRGLLPGGGWFWSDFEMPEAPVMQPVARVVVGMLYQFFGLATGLRTRQLCRPQAAFAAAGLRCRQRRTGLWGMLAAELWVAGSLRS